MLGMMPRSKARVLKAPSTELVDPRPQVYPV
jgi:hypothetical protein